MLITHLTYKSYYGKLTLPEETLYNEVLLSFDKPVLQSFYENNLDALHLIKIIKKYGRNSNFFKLVFQEFLQDKRLPSRRVISSNSRKIKFLVSKAFKRINRLTKTQPAPKRFIGVGYRDKGNARNSSLDGSPSWQEVYHSSLEEPKVFKTLGDRCYYLYCK